LCVQSTSFPWQVYFLVCTVNKFPLTSLLSRVYSQQVSFDKFTFSCVQSTSFPWQVYFLVCIVNKFPLTSFAACAHGIHVKTFVCQNHRGISCTLTQSWTNLPCSKAGKTRFGTRFLDKGKFVNFLPRSQLEIFKINQSLYWLQGYTETLSMRAFSSMHVQIRISVSYLIDSFGLSDQNWPKWIHVFGHTYLKLQSFLFHLTIRWMCRVWPCLTDAP
jgi:hypothetical protein